MRTVNVIYKNSFELMKIINEKEIGGRNILVQIFAGTLDEEIILNVINEIKKLLPDGIIIGTTTAGEIINGSIMTNSIVISFSMFEETEIKSLVLEECKGDYFEMGKETANTIITPDTKAIIMFSDTLHANREELLKGIEYVNNEVTVSGGVAGDNFAITGGKIFFGDKIISSGSGIVAVSLNNPNLKVYSTYSLGWESIGKKMVATETEGSKIYTLDNVPTFEMYKKYLGKEISDNLMNFSGAEFPIIVDRDGVKIAREAITTNEDGSVTYSGKIYKGEKIQFGYGNANLILQNIEKIVEELEQIELESIFIYSCAARKAFLKDSIISEIEPLKKYADMAGFFTYGEFFHLHNRNETLNMTMTLVGFSEKRQNENIKGLSREKGIKDYYEKNSMANIRALTHLVTVVTNELEEKNSMLSEKNEELNRKNNNIMQSIDYARRIQTALLPVNEEMTKMFSEYFILWKPKDIVGGDLYWYKQYGDNAFLAVFDCTGHGVPGALMTMIVNSSLHNIIEDTGSSSPAEIIGELNKVIKKTLYKETDDKSVDDGLDIGLCYIKGREKEMAFSGAKISLYVVKSGQLSEISGNRQSVGYRRSKEEYKYTDNIIKYEENDIFYLATDGISDQNGGEKDLPFGKNRLKMLIKEIYENEMEMQKTAVENRMKEYMKDELQRDDVTMMAFKIRH